MNHLPSSIVLLVACLGAPVAGQELRGHVLVAAFNPGPWHPQTGTAGGVFVVHPRTPGAVTPVSGLPPEITGAVGATAHNVGAASILALPDGDLLVGEVTPPAGTFAAVDGLLEVHRLRLAVVGGGWTATVLASHAIGNVPSSGGGSTEVSAMALLPHGNVLLVWNGASLSAPMAGVHFAELDLGTGTVTPWTISGAPAVVDSLAIDGAGTTLYLGEFSLATNRGNVWKAPVPVGSLTTAATPWTTSSTMGGVMSLAIDNQGDVIVGTYGNNGVMGVAPSLHRVAAATRVVTDLLPGNNGVRNAVLVERNTTDTCFWAGVRLDVVVAGGSWTLVPGGALAPWGIVAGLAMMPAVESFGASSTCVSTGGYSWQTAPNPGGLPLVDSPGFSITIATPSPQPFALFGVSMGPAAPAPVPIVWCAQLLLEPAQPISVLLGSPVGVPVPATTFSLPLPIPNHPVLARQSVYAQSFHLAGPALSVLESSPGLVLTIL